MQHTNTPMRHAWSKRLLSLLLAFVLVLGLVPSFPLLGGETASAHWADTYMDEMVEYGFIQPNHNPDGLLTRAEFMATVNRAYGYTQNGPTPFEDIEPTDWYYDDVGIAYNARYINGTSPTTVSPNDSLNRETAATILGRNMMLKESEGEILDFFDARDISSWARGTIKSSLEHYLVNGYDDGTFQPQREMTWGEMAAMVTRIVGMPIQEPGDYALGGVYGNVTITSEGVTLRDSIISGDLYITGGVGLGDIKLENVTVLGRIIASGTGESENGQASIVLRNVVADELLVDNLQKNFVTVQVDGVTEIGKATVRTGSYLEDNTPEGLGLKNIYLEGDYGTRLDLAGRIENVVIKTPGAQVNVAKGTVASMTVDELAPDTNVNISRGTEVKLLNLDIGAYVSGDGDIKELYVNAEGAIVTMLPEKVHIRPGITAIIHNQIMDSTAAEEASRLPMLLSGYPLANDVSPTSFQAVFATNKKGTVYWAVSAISDGSVDTEDLLHPPTYGGIAVAKGSVAIPAAEELVGATVGTPATTGTTGNNRNPATTTSVLTPGGSYYLAAVFVDDRGEQSPTKVIALTLPDDSVPAFAEGYPYMSLVSTTDAQVTVMPTKDCILFYALLPVGAQAPTENDFKTGSISGGLGYGVRAVYKNVEDVFNVNDQRLEELTTYHLYLWLVDSDGANKSEIYGPIVFTTPDETPPEFDPDPDPLNALETSVEFTFGLTEPGTAYWVVVEQGDDRFPRVNPQTHTASLTDLYVKGQVESPGSNAAVAASGSTAVTAANLNGTFRANGLKEETSYTLYYVAKDLAGNYSLTVKTLNFKTRDTTPPYVVSVKPTEPIGNEAKVLTGVEITLSEDVRYSGGVTSISDESFLALYDAVLAAQTSLESGTGKKEQVEAAKEKMAKALEACIRVYESEKANGPWTLLAGHTDPTEGSFDKYSYDPNNPTKEYRVIDFTQAVIEKNKAGQLVITFPISAMHLKSNRHYRFDLVNITDTATPGNPLVDEDGEQHSGPIEAGGFPTVLATVTLDVSAPEYEQWPYLRNDAGALLKTVVNETSGTSTREPVDNDPTYWPTTDGWTEDMLVPEEDNSTSFFRMTSNDTETVLDTNVFDILLCQNKVASYQLYYRILETGTDGREHQNTSEIVDAGYGLPFSSTVSNNNNRPDGNGWIYLGQNGHSTIETEGDVAFRTLSLTKDFLGYSATTRYPKLNSIRKDAIYEFAIVLTELNNESRPGRWRDTIDFEIGVIGGTNTLVSTVSNSVREGKNWASIAGDNATVSIISEHDYPQNSLPGGYPADFPTGFLPLSKTLNGGLPPEFLIGYPTFETTSSSVTMNIALDTEGYYYYAIAKASELNIVTEYYTEDPNTVSNPGTRSIRNKEVDWPTDNGNEGNVGGKYYYHEVPTSGSGEQPRYGWASPLYTTIANETQLRGYGIKHYGGGDCSQIDLVTNVTVPASANEENLEPNTTYYVYFTLARSRGNAAAPIYVYQFTTKPYEKPRTHLETDIHWTGEMTFSTDIDATGRYFVLTDSTTLNNFSFVNQSFAAWAAIGFREDGTAYTSADEDYSEETALKVPEGYLKDFTVLDALTTGYTVQLATDACNGNTEQVYIPTDVYTGTDPNEAGSYTVFDIYASEVARSRLYEIFRNLANSQNLGGPTGTPYVNTAIDTEAGWVEVTEKIREDIPTIEEGTYYVFYCAKDAGVSQDIATFVSFRATRMEIADQNTPKVTNAMGYLTKNGSGYTFELSIIFEKFVYLEHLLANNTPSGEPRPITELPNSVVNGNGLVDSDLTGKFTGMNAASMAVKSTAQNSFTVTIPLFGIGGEWSAPGRIFYNKLGAFAGEALEIELTSGTQGDQTVGFLTVRWGGTVVCSQKVVYVQEVPLTITRTGGTDSTAVLSQANGIYALEMSAATSNLTTILTASCGAIDTTTYSYTWAYGNSDVISVVPDQSDSSKATITALKDGTATLTVMAFSNGSMVAQTTVTVTVKLPITLTGGNITQITDDSYTLALSNDTPVSLSASSTITTGVSYSWASSAPTIVGFGTANATTATATGANVSIIALKDGTATVTLTATGPGGTTVTRTITVTVTGVSQTANKTPTPVTTAPLSFQAISNGTNVLSGSTLTLTEAQTTATIANVTGGPANATKYEWKSGNPDIVSVSGTGKTPQLVANGLGETTMTLTVTGADGKQTTKTVTVKVTGSPTVSGAKINDTSGTFTMKQSSKSGVDYEVNWTASASTKNAKLDIGLGKLAKTTVTWEIVSGNSVQFSVNGKTQKTATGTTATLKYLNNGTTTIRVTAGNVVKIIEVTATNASGPNLNLAVK